MEEVSSKMTIAVIMVHLSCHEMEYLCCKIKKDLKKRLGQLLVCARSSFLAVSRL